MYDIEALRRLREKFDFDDEKDRRKFVKQLERCIKDWVDQLSKLNLTSKDVDNDCLPTETCRKSQLPDLKLILEKEEIDRLLTDALYGRNRFILLAIETSGLTHLHVACLFGCEDAARLLLKHGADPMVRLLLEHGANPNLSDARGRTALHWICEELGDDWFLAQMLLELCDERFRPLRLDARDELGDTPLNLAMESENELLVRLLLMNGADRALTVRQDVLSSELAKLERLAIDSNV
ncbi:hypothetical protein TKK_0010710 [Trichogramma kaykai]